MNLSPAWVAALASKGVKSVHWSSIGKADAEDAEIVEWARSNGYIIFTHDLDFGMILALTRAKSPSVIQVRAQDILPAGLADRFLKVLEENSAFLEQGALIVVDETNLRLRILPL